MKMERRVYRESRTNARDGGTGPYLIPLDTWVERKMAPGESFPGERWVFRSNKTPPERSPKSGGTADFEMYRVDIENITVLLTRVPEMLCIF